MAAETKQRIHPTRAPLPAGRAEGAGDPREQRDRARAVVHLAVEVCDHALVEIEAVAGGEGGLSTRIDEVYVVALAQLQQPDIVPAERAIPVIDDMQRRHGRASGR